MVDSDLESGTPNNVVFIPSCLIWCCWTAGKKHWGPPATFSWQSRNPRNNSPWNEPGEKKHWAPQPTTSPCDGSGPTPLWPCKNMQWKVKFVVMLGGLLIEMALWSTMGDLLRGSGWPEALKEAGLVIGCWRHPMWWEQDMPIKLLLWYYSLLKRAYEDSGTGMVLEDWVERVAHESPTFSFWLLVYKYQQSIFMFIRAHREQKIKLMVTTMFLLFLCSSVLCSWPS